MDDMNVSHSNIRASQVNGTAVYGANGEHMGSVEDFVVGKSDGQVKYAILGIGGFLGIGEEHHTVPWNQLTYDTSRGGYVVNVTRDRLEGAPRSGHGAEPDYRAVDTYYAV